MRKTIARLSPARTARELELFVAAGCIMPNVGHTSAGEQIKVKMVPEDVVGSRRLFFVNAADDPSPGRVQTVTPAIRQRVAAQAEARKQSALHDAQALLEHLRGRQRDLAVQIEAAEQACARLTAS